MRPFVSQTCLMNMCRYYSALGVRQLSDVFDVAAGHVDGVKFAGGSFMVMPEQAVQAITALCHQHQVRAPVCVWLGAAASRALQVHNQQRLLLGPMDTSCGCSWSVCLAHSMHL